MTVIAPEVPCGTFEIGGRCVASPLTWGYGTILVPAVIVFLIALLVSKK
jgi:ABC-type dipeptide/oligopeptide/nickel transport system permease subunit